ncbi:GntR family transcriptional regulator [Novosphingobium sp. RL4]|uniref:GntR family transcriptional regulator n=1 Tax=Novosphingobium sp. RL4 TaxID=3109595 RepID=UPI002D786735|nr:GntR family transcriptional regulator [Novosphingobium sp. RL4]WRT94465.1 GntR family transcriptional regulator [Novosphingobium sp. RL4]
MNAGTRAELAYEEVKRLVLSGAIAPGQRLDPVKLGAELSAGVTPVREALLRLAGERVVEMRKNTGFHLPVMTEVMLMDLYRWNFEVLRLAVASPTWKYSDDDTRRIPANAANDAASLFAAIAQKSARPEITAQIASANDRLMVARSAEAQVLGDRRSEIKTIISATQHPRSTLTGELRKYHSRRLSNARKLVTSIYKISDRSDNTSENL